MKKPYILLQWAPVRTNSFFFQSHKRNLYKEALPSGQHNTDTFFAVKISPDGRVPSEIATIPEVATVARTEK